ncbi:MAG: cytochrome D1 domain-containing protein [Bacteroidota bacterium]|nr:cytochrome D1 domain-containing protein [Bacteroidota bacterium]
MQVELKQKYSGHKQNIYALETRGQHFYTGGGDGYVVAWDMEKGDMGEVIAQTNAPIYCITIFAEKELMFIGTAHGNMHVIDLKENKEINFIVLENKGIFSIKIVGEKLYITGGDGILYILALADYHIIQKIQVSSKSLRGIDIWNELLALGTGEGQVRILDMNTGKMVSEFTEQIQTVFAVKFSSDGNYIYSGGRDALLVSYDRMEQKLISKIPAHTLHIHSIELSPDEKLLATSSMDKSIKIWDRNSMELLKVIDAPKYGLHLSSVNKIIWVNQQQILSVSDDKTAALWQIEN